MVELSLALYVDVKSAFATNTRTSAEVGLVRKEMEKDARGHLSQKRLTECYTRTDGRLLEKG